MKPGEGHPLFTEQELFALTAAIDDGEGREVTDDEFQGFLNWASEVRLRAIILEQVLGRLLLVKRNTEGRYKYIARPEVRAHMVVGGKD